MWPLSLGLRRRMFDSAPSTELACGSRPEPGTPGTPNPAARGSSGQGQKTTDIRQSTTCGTRGTPYIGDADADGAPPATTSAEVPLRHDPAHQ
jgi:hypothetical protein